MKRYKLCRVLRMMVIVAIFTFGSSTALLALDSLLFNADAPINIDAAHGITCEEEQKKCFVKNGVRVEQNGMILNADSLTTLFSSANRESGIKEIIADGHVHISTASGNRIDADQVIVNLESKALTINGSAIEIHYDKMILKANQHVSYAQEKQGLKATGDVSVKDDQYVLKSDTVYAYFTKNVSGKTALSKLIVPKDCIISTPNEYIEAKHGTYDVQKKQILLEGNVMITRENGQLRGDVVEVDLASGNSKVTRERGRAQLLILPEKRED
ncbi:MAG: hypothetical protein K2X53_03670 [Alphaproteobacteria bacterium]|nr:hypothetical protein [Alphaproteobacteria bacterium]